MADDETVRYEPRDRVVTILLDRPEVGNAINSQLAMELGKAWVRFRDDPQLDVAILTGAGESFCVGADMHQMAAHFAARKRGDSVGSQPIQGLASAWPHQHLVGKPIVCAINGRCAGIGLAFVSESDIVIASDNAAFSDPHVSWGGISAGAMVRLVGRVPIEALLCLSLLGKGEWLRAERACQLGLVSQVMASSDLLPNARALAERILMASQPAVRAQRAALWHAIEALLDPALAAARDPAARFSASTQLRNIAEGTTAFTQQRLPEYERSRQLFDANQRIGGAMGDVTTRSGRVHYEVAGQPVAIGPIVLLHGMGMASSSYADIVPGLAAASQVFAFDSPGHGESEHPADDGEFPVERFADAVLDSLDGLGLGRVNLVGNSLGAMTALEFAATYPDRVRRLVLVGCPGWDGRQRSERLAARQQAGAQRPNADQPLTPADLAPMFTAPTEEVAERVTRARRQSAPFSPRSGMAVLTHDTLGRSFSVTAPTLLLCGERDIVVPDQPRFLRSIPDCRLVIFENSGHYPQVDNPNRFVSTVLEFLGE